jgi:molybdate transport system regulatory protein
MPIHASLLFTDEKRSAGRNRIRLLAAVAQEGSISGAARAVGLSYKAAWDAIHSMNTLFGRELVEARTGGRRGGGAYLTLSGIRVVETLNRLEGELTRALRRLNPTLTQSGLLVSNATPGFVLRTSARNVLRGIIKDIKADNVSGDVYLAIAGRTTIYATVTQDSLRELGLCLGREVLALIKASYVSIVPSDRERRPAGCNCLRAVLVRRQRGEANIEFTLDIGSGKLLIASMQAERCKTLKLRVGGSVWATFSSRHVILAID